MSPHHEDAAAQDALHRLLESLGNASGVLLDLRIYLERLDARDRRFVRLILRASVIFALGMIAAFVVTGCEVRDADTAASSAKRAAARADALISENRQLIDRLEVVAIDAQRQGAEADRKQCRQIEVLKGRLRAILRLAGAQRGRTPSLRRALELLKEENCTDLPNARPVTP